MFLFFFLFWIKYLLVWKYCDKKDMLILYKTWEQLYVQYNICMSSIIDVYKRQLYVQC